MLRIRHRRNIARVHDRVTAEHVHDAGYRVETNVLGQDLGGVLGADQAGFEHRETRGHPHDQRAHDEKVKSIERVRKFSDLRRNLSCFFHEIILRVSVKRLRCRSHRCEYEWPEQVR